MRAIAALSTRRIVQQFDEPRQQLRCLTNPLPGTHLQGRHSGALRIDEPE